MITIRHSDAEGTVVHGSAKGDGVWEILRGLGWKYRRVPGIHLQRSRYKPPQRGRIEAAAMALREVGHEVTVDIDAERMSFADAEAARAEAAEDRAERLDARAERVGAQANADYDRAHQMAEAIPFGQPMMPDHYSYGRDRRYRDKIHNTYGRAFAGMDEARELARRAAGVTGDRSTESVGTTLRRIKGLEAEERGVQGEIAGGLRGRRPYQYEAKPAAGARKARLEERLAEIGEQLAYWRAQLVERRAVVFGPDDFQRGDFARGTHGWYEVLRVNKTSVTVPDPIVLIGVCEVFSRAEAERVSEARHFGRVLTQTLPYDKITGRRSAAEMEEGES